MKVGDLVFDLMNKKRGLLIQQDWETDIGTPFDWLVLYFDGSREGADERYLEMVR